MSSKIPTSQLYNTVLSQFNGFMVNEIKELKRESFKFNHQNDCLHDFYFQHACVHNYKELSFVVKVVSALSHGQVTVECGFSINKSVKTNMTPQSIISCRMIKDHLLANGLKPHNIEVTTPLIKAFRSTC